MTSELVKSGNMDGVIKFITHGSPVDSQSLVKMPAKGGHLDLGDEEIRDIAKQVIEMAENYVEKKPAKSVSRGGYFNDRFGPIVSTAVETAPVVSWPPSENAPERAKRLYQREKKLLDKIREVGGKEYDRIGLDDLSKLKSKDLSSPSDQIQGTSTNSPKNESPLFAIDDQPATKYLNFDGAGSGLEIKVQNTIVNGITITSANDAPERDPKSFLLSGSKDGKNFTQIASGSIPVSRGRGKLKTMRFPNGKSFTNYRVVFPELVGDGNIPMQIAEFELLPKLEGSPIDELSREATKLLGQIDEVTQRVRYIVSRAHLVPLGEDRRAGMVFDSETLSYSLAWMNDQSLKASGMPFAGAHGAAAVVKESYNLFRTNMQPGWAKAKEMIKKDPRPSALQIISENGNLAQKLGPF
jgi:hypothetical protein